ncbi:MAG: hypothetical protein ATN35_07045 [Epulopiscium sp. Nele67-Bin004]|nr:MAG: hypothetical protein ATN35_07045 [Epulopiscium sp. Nele67-Bin004]
MRRSSGIIMHISSLGEKYGIGTFGKEAYNFANFLNRAGQKYWQILPLGHTSYGDSPYQSFSAFAGNPYFIDFDLLHTEGLLQKEDYENRYYGNNPEYVDYAALFDERLEVLNIAYQNSKGKVDLTEFKKQQQFWLEDYALYMAIKEPEFLLQFNDYFPNLNKVILDINYRSVPAIIEHSNRLILCNKNRFNKVMVPHKTGTTKPVIINCKDDNEQADIIINKILELKGKKFPLENIAIIYRNNMQAYSLLESLINLSVPFKIRDSMPSLYNHWITKDLLAYFKLAQNLSDIEHCARVINKPARYISRDILKNLQQNNINLVTLVRQGSLEKWQQEALEQLIYHLQLLKTKPLKDGITFIKNVIGYNNYLIKYAEYRRLPLNNFMEIFNEIEASCQDFDDYEQWEENLRHVSESIQNNKNKYIKDAITLSTMHSAKGLEFDIVFIIDAVDEVIPHYKSTTVDEIEEERRLFYVAITRAKENLYIYIPKKRHGNNMEQSPFIEDMLFADITLNVGNKIRHKRYGSGIIKAIDDKSATVKFDKTGIITIDHKFCLKKNIIEIEE